MVYLGYMETLEQPGTAADDAAELGWFHVDHLPSLAFDHARIIADVLKLY